jgi:hypothetical protein
MTRACLNLLALKITIILRQGCPPPSGRRTTRSADRRGHPLDHPTPRNSLLQKKSCLVHSAGRCDHPRAPCEPGRLMPPPCGPILRPALTPPSPARIHPAPPRAHPSRPSTATRPIRTQLSRPRRASPPPPRHRWEKVVADWDIVSRGRLIEDTTSGEEPYDANACFKCFRCFKSMLQLFHLDIAIRVLHMLHMLQMF